MFTYATTQRQYNKGWEKMFLLFVFLKREVIKKRNFIIIFIEKKEKKKKVFRYEKKKS